MTIRLSTAELKFLQDFEQRMIAVEHCRQNGDDRTRAIMARELKQAGHALIAAADAITSRLLDEAEERATVPPEVPRG